jgi:hypothetical protein
VIIRTSFRREFTALPNALFTDKRLSPDTKGMLGFLLAKPPKWQVRPAALAKQLSPIIGPPVGKERLRRMFAEAQSAGYMARSERQMHDDDGTWGSYVYIVGPDPTLVAQETARLSDSVAFLPQPAEPSAANPHTYKEKKDIKYPNLKTERSEFQYADAAIAGAQQGQSIEEKRAEMSRTVCRPERVEIVQNRIAQRLGERGWLILQNLPPGELDQLTAQERNGCLGERVLAELHRRFPSSNDWRASRDKWRAAAADFSAAVDALNRDGSDGGGA